MSARDRFGTCLILQQHQPRAEEDILLRSGVVHAWSAGAQTQNPGSSSVTAVALEAQVEAFHKAASGVNRQQAALYGHDTFSVLINESVAWILAKSLGAPYDHFVPATMIRSLWPAPPLKQGFGALSQRKPGVTNAADPLADPAYCDPAAFFDALIGQQDRHDANYRWHAATGELGLIDNGYAFASPTLSSVTQQPFIGNASRFVEERLRAGRDQLSQPETQLLQDFIADQIFRDNLSLLLRAEQLSALTDRANRMLQSGRLLQVLEF